MKMLCIPDATLLNVVTIQEAALLWDKHPLTVRRALNSRCKPLVGRKSPDIERGIWLISYQSCIDRWGSPRSLE